MLFLLVCNGQTVVKLPCNGYGLVPDIAPAIAGAAVVAPPALRLLPKLLSEKVITYENKAKATGTCKAEALLDDTIKTSLSVGYLDSFYKLQRVMKDTQSNACIQLVNSMISDGIPISNHGESALEVHPQSMILS